MGKKWKKLWLSRKVEAAKAQPAPQLQKPEPVVETKVEEPKETKKSSSKGYRKKTKTTTKKGD